eukprot:INCI6056.3.p1 GENE.INCI6056.3~~INCI6056.3.p1  ORF type:complete len:390 (-),score=84.72 INCI6056.3:121-1290(-)
MPFECSSQRQAALIARQINAARLTKCLTLSQLSLRTVPAEVFTLTDLVRLDLGDNHLSELPEQIGQLTSLEQLWLNNNPLAELPPQVEQCTRLRQLDLRATLIKALPRELGRLKNLVDVDILDIPLKTKLANAHAAGGTTNLLKALQDKDVRKTLKIELEKKLADGIYREVADEPGARDRIFQLVKSLFKEFTQVEEQRSLIRNCERLLPENLDKADAQKTRATFVKLRRENEKKKLMAEVELKLRAIYFDRIASSKVEHLVNNIAEVFVPLEDVQFLLKHARELFPNEVPEDTRDVFSQMVQLRDRLAAERAEALQSLLKALRNMYHDVDTPRIQALLDEVATRFQKTEQIRKLTSDATNYFPVEFDMCDAQSVRRTFIQQRRALAGY